MRLFLWDYFGSLLKYFREVSKLIICSSVWGGRKAVQNDIPYCVNKVVYPFLVPGYYGRATYTNSFLSFFFFMSGEIVPFRA